MKTIFSIKSIVLCYLSLFYVVAGCVAQDAQGQNERDERVRKFLEENQRHWRDLNVPYEDGQILHDLIVANNYQSALEIGTSTGHSTIWIAWALSKTGGKLTTLEIDADRQQQAIENVEAVGLSDVVDFKLGNAHELVKEIEGPLDFVFLDADKDWYVQYFKDVHPKLKAGGRFTAHNVLQNLRGIPEYLEFVKGHSDYQTTIDRTSSSGIAVSHKQ